MGSPIIKKRVQYGSLGYKILNYARFRSRHGDGTFSVIEYQEFRYKSVKPSYIKRAVDALVRHGHLQKLGEDRYQYIETNALYELDHAYKDTLYRKVKDNRKRYFKEKEELDDIQSDDF